MHEFTVRPLMQDLSTCVRRWIVSRQTPRLSQPTVTRKVCQRLVLKKRGREGERGEKTTVGWRLRKRLLCCVKFSFFFFLRNMERLKQTQSTFTLDWSLGISLPPEQRGEQNRAKLSEPRRDQLNPPRKKKKKKRRCHIHINNKCSFWKASFWSDEHTENTEHASKQTSC